MTSWHFAVDFERFQRPKLTDFVRQSTKKPTGSDSRLDDTETPCLARSADKPFRGQQVTEYDLYQIVVNSPKERTSEGAFVRIPVSQFYPFEVSEDDLNSLLYKMDARYGKCRHFFCNEDVFPDYYIEDGVLVVQVNLYLLRADS